MASIADTRFPLSSAAVTTSTTGTYAAFVGRTGAYRFGYVGVLDGATIQLKFKESPHAGVTDEAKSALGAALTSSLPSIDVNISNGEYLTYQTTGAGASTSVVPTLTYLGAV